ncbi:MAG: DoxX family protein [Pseudomonas sp.]
MSPALTVLRRLSLTMALVIAAWAWSLQLSIATTLWFALASNAWLLLMLLAAAWLQAGSLRALGALLLCVATVGRLFSTLHTAGPATASSRDLLLQVETGPGVPGFGWLCLGLGALLLMQFVLLAGQRIARTAARAAVQHWVLVFLRLYVGTMFVPHFAGHLFAGPEAFSIYRQYFASLQLPAAALLLVLAGVTELLVAAGLVLGIGTRLAGLVGAGYLLLTLWTGGHLRIGYVWILPDGGYEFGLLWAVLCGLFVLVGNGERRPSGPALPPSQSYLHRAV